MLRHAGVYPIKPQLPAIGGNEGVAVVEEVGSAVTDLRVGDWVLPTTPGFGTWRTHAVHAADEFTRVANDIPPEYAATLTVNPATAYRMLKDFADLRAGDTVVQNGATSAVGRSVIQIAHARGINTINIVRDRPNLAETEAALKAIGATHVVTEEFARTPAMRDIGM
jgi:trans-2-enoyl-CoA reductase